MLQILGYYSQEFLQNSSAINIISLPKRHVLIMDVGYIFIVGHIFMASRLMISEMKVFYITSGIHIRKWHFKISAGQDIDILKTV